MFNMKMHYSVEINYAIEQVNILQRFFGQFATNDNKLQTFDDCKKFLQGQLELGRRVLPYGACDNFDYQRGCMGHKVEEDEQHG